MAQEVTPEALDVPPSTIDAFDLSSDILEDEPAVLPFLSSLTALLKDEAMRP
jgi:hypothetical protein